MAKAIIIKDEKHFVKKVKNASNGSASIRYKKPYAKAYDTIPFRIKFINIGIASYSPNNPAPIGIAVIGVNNYIL